MTAEIRPSRTFRSRGMMAIADLIRKRAVRPLERMNSPLEIRKVHLRGLGGRPVCGVACTGASATGITHQIREEHNSRLESREALATLPLAAAFEPASAAAG